MSAFDPYRKWFGIAPADQPPNHYRLLGLDVFEADPDVIDAATEQRVVFLRTCATGEHIAESQKLLNEVAAARLCLLNTDKKRSYDEQLRANVADAASVRADRANRQEFDSPPVAEPGRLKTTTLRFAKASATNFGTLMMKHRRAWGVAGVVLLVAAGCWFGWSESGDRPTESDSDGETGKTITAKSLTGQSAGAEWTANGLKMPFRWCPPGTFEMGSPKGAKIHYEDEGPVSVTLSRGFWMGKYEVTQAEWREVMGSTPWQGGENVAEGDRYPAVSITWHDATLYCRTLTEKERRAGRLPKDWEYRLPTEAQWEYACRAGTETQYSFGNDDNQLVEHAWFMTNSPSLKPVHEIGGKQPNAWGLCDMHGNVTEWCRDRYSQTLIGGLAPEAPEGVLPALDRVRRGGSVLSQSTACRSAFRGRDVPARRWYDLGFRVAIVDMRSEAAGTTAASVLAKPSNTSSVSTDQTLTKDEMVGVWRIQSGLNLGEMTLLANGKINAPDAINTWTLEKSTLSLKWPNTRAPNGVWIDRCTVSKDGKSFDGSNQGGVHVAGQRKSRDGVGANTNASASAPIFVRYEAEKAKLGGLAMIFGDGNAAAGSKVRRIDTPDSFVEFTFQTATSGKYRAAIRYSNGFGDRPAATHRVSVNGNSAGTISYPPTGWWSGFKIVSLIVDLNVGTNRIRLSHGNHFAEIDCLDLSLVSD